MCWRAPSNMGLPDCVRGLLWVPACMVGAFVTFGEQHVKVGAGARIPPRLAYERDFDLKK